MAAGKQPEYFFRTFVEAVKPSINSLSPHRPSSWWMPYSALLGVHSQTIARWKAAKRLPEHAWQKVLNVIALHEIASLEGSEATVERAQDIARTRLANALEAIPEPKPATQRKPRFHHGPASRPRPKPDDPYRRSYRWTSEDETWRAAELHAEGYTVPEIAKMMNRDDKTVDRMIRRVTGSPGRLAGRGGARNGCWKREQV